MKKVLVFAMLIIANVTAFAQQFTKEQQELIDLSNQKWAWMAEKNADRLAELFLDSAMFVHMGRLVGGQAGGGCHPWGHDMVQACRHPFAGGEVYG